MDLDKVDIIAKYICIWHNLIIDKEVLTFLDVPEIEFEPLQNVLISRGYNNYSR